MATAKQAVASRGIVLTAVAGEVKDRRGKDGAAAIMKITAEEEEEREKKNEEQKGAENAKGGGRRQKNWTGVVAKGEMTERGQDNAGWDNGDAADEVSSVTTKETSMV